MKAWWWPFIVGVAFGALVVLLVWKYGPAQPRKTSLKVTGPDGKASIEFNVEGDSVDYSQLLNKMFDDDFLRPAAIGWLGEKKKLYPLHEERLATAIAQELCEPIPDLPLEERLEKGKTCANKPVPSRLRALAFDHKPPFHYIGVPVKAGVPAEPRDQPQTHRANVCREGGFLGKRLQVINPRTQKTLIVKAANSYTCTGYVRFPGIQLSPQDATALFEGQPLAALEDVIVVPLE
jgi:hypothetical protein